MYMTAPTATTPSTIQAPTATTPSTIQTTNQNEMYMTAPTATTPSTIQTIQHNVGYNQNLVLQGVAGSGNIGISSNNPQAKLHVGGSTVELL